MKFCTVVVTGNPGQLVATIFFYELNRKYFAVPVIVLRSKYYLSHPNEESIIISTN